MAKDVDLSSQEWLDIVFEGKNKEFGAYELRANSVKRHTKSVIVVLCIFIALGILLFLSISGVFAKAEEDTNAMVQQDMVDFAGDDDDVDDQDDDVFDMPEETPPEEQILEEDVASSISNTILDIKDDDQVVNQVANQDDLLEDNRAIGSVTVDGVDDLTKTLVTTQVVVEEVHQQVEEPIYTTANVQQLPSFPGGEQAMYRWLSEHIQYPAQAAEEGVSGRVVVEFIVSKTGKIENARVLRGRHPALDREALRVVNAMPDWTPGRNNGQAVKVTYNLPVTFRLQQ